MFTPMLADDLDRPPFWATDLDDFEERLHLQLFTDSAEDPGMADMLSAFAQQFTSYRLIHHDVLVPDILHCPDEAMPVGQTSAESSRSPCPLERWTWTKVEEQIREGPPECARIRRRLDG
jgi:hypothetical protein